MSNSIAIEFEHVSKQYRLGLVSTKTLSHDIRRFWITNVLGKEDPYLKIGETNDRASKGNSDYVWALRDIDFKVEQGDVVGIIGKNGAGKSTLLKLLSRVTGPTTGTIRAKGRIGSLLEVGTGFHGEMTGRENIFLNGAILGMSRAEIQSKLDEIIDFSGCERYIDTPVKRYSSGMTVRLGFAVAAFLEPEILVVDEVLAVGDAEFQKKAIGKMKDVSQGQGRTVLFVSHNMASIKNLCTAGVLLEYGQIKSIGEVGKVLDDYLQGSLVASQLQGRVHAQNQYAWFEDIIIKRNGKSIDRIISGDNIDIECYIGRKHKKDLNIALGVYNSYGVKVSHLETKIVNFSIEANTSITFSISRLSLNEGMYSINAAILDAYDNCFDFVENALVFHVDGGDFYHTGRLPLGSFGNVLLDYNCK